MVVFFSAIVSVLYYLGVMQAVIKVISALLEYALRTTPIESFATATHIFIGQVSRKNHVILKPTPIVSLDETFHIYNVQVFIKRCPLDSFRLMYFIR